MRLSYTLKNTTTVRRSSRTICIVFAMLSKLNFKVHGQTDYNALRSILQDFITFHTPICHTMTDIVIGLHSGKEFLVVVLK